jgi:hypothetical protein
MTSNRIMKLEDHKNAKIFRAACDCGSSDCDMHIELENEPDTWFLSLTIYKKLRWSSYWGDCNFFTEKWRRIKCSLKMLFTGYIEVEETFLMREHQIDDFVDALIEGKRQLEIERKNNDSN